MNKINKNTMVSATCPNCGVEIICSAFDPAVKCHWCHTTIPASLYIENHNMPDQILPFLVKKEQAKTAIDNFVKERKTFSNKTFINEFDSETIVPVYLPYMIVDINLHSENSGITINQKNRDTAIHKEYIKRNFEMTIKDALVEASKSNYFNSINSTSNVISLAAPFDLVNAVEFNPNFLKGYTSENRELNFDLLLGEATRIATESRDRFLLEELSDYFKSIENKHQRHVEWYHQKNKILGTQWSSIYLPVWIYSYCIKENNIITRYYIAVNGRTGKVVGSIPLDRYKFNIRKKLIGWQYYLIMLIGSIFLISFFSKRAIDAPGYYGILCYLLPIFVILTNEFRKKYKKKKTYELENYYIAKEKMDNTSIAEVTVYDWDYNNYHNKVSELRKK